MDYNDLYLKVKNFIKKEKYVVHVSKSSDPYIFLYLSSSNHLDYEFKDEEWIIYLDWNYGHRKQLGKIVSFNKVNLDESLWKGLPKSIKDFIEKLNVLFKESLKSNFVDFVISKVRVKLAASVTVKPYSIDIFKSIEIPMAHRAEHEEYYVAEEWQKTQFNYRLNSATSIYYAYKNRKVIGHLGLDDDDRVRAVYIDPEFRRKGIAAKIYEAVFKRNARIFSDDAQAMEPEIINMWHKLKKKFPDNIKQNEDKSFIYEA